MKEFLEIISVIILVFVFPLFASLKLFNKYLKKKSDYTAEEFEREEKYFPEVILFLTSAAVALVSAGISGMLYLIFKSKTMAFAVAMIGSAYFGAILPFIVLWYKLINKQQNVKKSLERYALGWSLLLVVFIFAPNFLIKTFGIALCVIILAQIAVHLVPLLKKEK